MFAPRLVTTQSKAAARSMNSFASQPAVQHHGLHPSQQSLIPDDACQPTAMSAREASIMPLDFSRIAVFATDQAERCPACSQPRALQPGVIQPKLLVGQVDDPLEHEADTVADYLMRMPDPELRINTSLPKLSRKGTAYEEETPKTPRTKPIGAPEAEVSHAPAIAHEVLGTQGRPLDSTTRTFFEPRFRHDLGEVRIHDDRRAAKSARSVGALAYTAGRHIVFGEGAYRTGTDAGRRLLAHELSHTVQQSRTPASQPRTMNTVSPAAVRLHSDVSSGIIRRDPVADAGSGGSTPDYSQLTWQQLLPRAHGAGGKRITSIDIHTPGNRIDTRGTGQAPTLNYAADKDIRTDPASAAPTGGAGGTPEADALAAAQSSDLSAAQDAAISQIITARTNIPDRPMRRSANNNAGYDYNPDIDKSAKEYNQWAKSALPTGVKSTDWNWEIFKRIQGLEGQEGRFTTFDKTLSVGPGYSTSAGQAQRVIGNTFKLLPEVKAVAFAAGLTVNPDGAMTVVDTEKKWILQGQDAAAYIQTEVSLLSLLINVSQGVQPVDGSASDSGTSSSIEQSRQCQALLDAEWQQFLRGTLANMTSLVQGWPLDSAVLAVHAKHAQPGNFPYTFWNTQNGPDLATMVTAIYDKAGASAKYICTGKFAKYLPASKDSGKLFNIYPIALRAGRDPAGTVTCASLRVRPDAARQEGSSLPGTGLPRTRLPDPRLRPGRGRPTPTWPRVSPAARSASCSAGIGRIRYRERLRGESSTPSPLLDDMGQLVRDEPLACGASLIDLVSHGVSLLTV